MDGRSLLDTNIIIALFSADPIISDRIAQAAEVFIPSVALGELYFGAHKSGRAKENHARIDDFALNNSILSCNADTAKRYGEIKDLLRTKGRPIPENDLWIAAIALQYDLILVTRDLHFKEVDRLNIEVW